MIDLEHVSETVFVQLLVPHSYVPHACLVPVFLVSVVVPQALFAQLLYPHDVSEEYSYILYVLSTVTSFPALSLHVAFTVLIPPPFKITSGV